MSIVTWDSPMTSDLQTLFSQKLQAYYPFVEREILTWTVQGREVEAFRIGEGNRTVIFTAAHHGNESITSLLLWRFLADYCQKTEQNQTLYGFSCRGLFRKTTLYAIPLVNPDGAELARRNPAWKANANGVDLNLNYPARWEQAKAIKAKAPGPRDYPGREPLDQPETIALAEFTRRIRPDTVAAWHTQGGEIYGAEDAFGHLLARESGYKLCQPPTESRNAGYRDWFEQEFGRPAYTIEAGRGENPLPLSDLPQMYRENLPIFALLLSGI